MRPVLGTVLAGVLLLAAGAAGALPAARPAPEKFIPTFAICHQHQAAAMHLASQVAHPFH
ncbi:MAG: hypothetical protein HPY69_21405 [Armatimonadetes bacterium]|nr:hypothetical protein [Armatimonadota bacterium]